MKIMVINPGSTSTKIALFEDDKEVYSRGIEHDESELSCFEDINDQLEFRTNAVLNSLSGAGIILNSLDAVVSRGGMITPICPGGYLIDEDLKNTILRGNIMPHASNLGALIADAIATPLGIPAYIYDAVASDEMNDIARITGMPEIVRQPYSHVLNTRAMARKYAESIEKKYEEINVIVSHIGGGVSVNVHEKGRIVDSIEDDGGPFSIERAGVIPLSYIVDMAYSGKYSKAELSKKLRGMGGVKAHLGTHNLKEVERRIADGDLYARVIYEALAYQIAKGIGELAPVLNGEYDAVIITGGAARSKMLTDWIIERVSFIAPVIVLPGENEMEALALGCLRILRGEETAQIYRQHIT
jgi:butyrate kinase